MENCERSQTLFTKLKSGQKLNVACSIEEVVTARLCFVYLLWQISKRGVK